MVTREENQEKRNCNEVTLKSATRVSARSHAAVDAPLCSGCRQFDLAFFDPSCPGCQEIVKDPKTTIAEIFAIIRQWVPQTQRNIELFVNEILRRGAHVDDRDSLTDMTLLHYSCKAGAGGVGDVYSALQVVKMLLERGANVQLRCQWTNMSALHYASYFDVAPVVKLILQECKVVDVNSQCRSYDNGTALHITARNLCLESAQILLDFGADIDVKDELSRTPLECIPLRSSYDLIPDIQDRVSRMQKLLSREPSPVTGTSGKINLGTISGKAVLQAMKLQLNDKVIVGGCKSGILRYCGTTEFATGIWAGIELDDNDGKNDGSLKGVMYFKCPPNHGIFAPVNRVCKASDVSSVKVSLSCRNIPRIRVNHGKIDVSHISPKVCTGLNLDRELREVKLGDRVIVPGSGGSRVGDDRSGTVRYIGTTTFASGCWVGVELDQDTDGRHDGTIGETRYFVCPPHRGILIPASRLTRYSTESEVAGVCISCGEKECGGHGWETHHTSLSLKQTNCLSRSQSVHARFQKSTRPRLFRSFSTSHSLSASTVHSSQGHSSKESTAKRTVWPLSSERRDFTLSLGMNVLYNHKVGIVKYIGPVEFADGKWLGLELKEPKGKHDGMVNGRRYFTSKPGHGIMVHPKNVTVHGINGEKLMVS